MMHWILLMALLAAAFADDAEPGTPLDAAHIVASKFSLSQYAVEGMDYVIDYRLYNVGDKTAVKVTLDDRDGFPTQAFEIVRGLLQVRWERIAPGANVSHAVVVRPRAVGAYNYTAAHVTYYASEDAKEVRVGYTSAPGEGYIYRQKDYDRKFSAKVEIWLLFLLLVSPSTIVPFALWYQSKVKYEQEPMNRKNK